MGERQYDAQRRQDSPTRALYGTQRWRRRSAHQLLMSPLCVMCLARGITCAASVADHIVPHRGDVDAFWGNELQSLCKPCHDRIKQREEARGYSDSIDADGWPIDPRHPANAHHGASVAQPAAVDQPPGGHPISTALRSATGGFSRARNTAILGVGGVVSSDSPDAA